MMVAKVAGGVGRPQPNTVRHRRVASSSRQWANGPLTSRGWYGAADDLPPHSSEGVVPCSIHAIRSNLPAVSQSNWSARESPLDIQSACRSWRCAFYWIVGVSYSQKTCWHGYLWGR